MENISISKCVASKTNTRGKVIKGSIEDLAKSIREKGVLVPILVRMMAKDYYEVIAGHRRLEAALEAGLSEIPARIVEMTDQEALEAQIVENLQREDIHPLEEGMAYRSLTESSGTSVANIAAKVGKSETYVRQRLALTNLSDRAAKLFRSNKLSAASAVLLARVESEKMQDQIITEAGEYRMNEPEILRKIIRNHVYLSLNKKPWANDAKLSELVGDKVGHVSLFGDENAGLDPVAYATQMAAFIELKMREAKEKGEELVKICTMYGKPEMRGVLGHDSYRILHSKEDIKEAKTKMKGIVAEGENLGRIFWITTDKERIDGSDLYRPSAKEKAARKAKLAKQKRRKASEASAFQKALSKVDGQLAEKQLDALLDFAFYRCGYSYQQPAANLLGLEPVRTEKEGYDGKMKKSIDWEATLRAYAGAGRSGKLRVVFALLMPHPSEYYMKEFNAAVKKL